MSIATYFSSKWTLFLDWFTSAKAAVVAEGKTIIDELEPIVKADILADGSTALLIVGEALVTGTDPLAAIALAATTVWKEGLAQGIDISKAASTTAGAFLVAKAKALQDAPAVVLVANPVTVETAPAV